MDFLEDVNKTDLVIKRVVEAARQKNIEFKKERLSSRELNDMSMQMFPVKAISEMVVAATNVFVQNVEKMMSGSIPPGFELIKNSECDQLCKAAKDFDYRYGFQHKDVLRLELEGSSYIKSMMGMLWRAISKGDDPNSRFERFVYGGVSVL